MKNSWIPNPIRRATSISSKGKCFHCGKVASEASTDRWNILRFKDENGIPFEIDHIKSRVSGGETTIENCKLSCRSCNRSRHRIPDKEMQETVNILETINE